MSAAVVGAEEAGVVAVTAVAVKAVVEPAVAVVAGKEVA